MYGSMLSKAVRKFAPGGKKVIGKAAEIYTTIEQRKTAEAQARAAALTPFTVSDGLFGMSWTTIGLIAGVVVVGVVLTQRRK